MEDNEGENELKRQNILKLLQEVREVKMNKLSQNGDRELQKLIKKEIKQKQNSQTREFDFQILKGENQKIQTWFFQKFPALKPFRFQTLDYEPINKFLVELKKCIEKKSGELKQSVALDSIQKNKGLLQENSNFKQVIQKQNVQQASLVKTIINQDQSNQNQHHHFEHLQTQNAQKIANLSHQILIQKQNIAALNNQLDHLREASNQRENQLISQIKMLQKDKRYPHEKENHQFPMRTGGGYLYETQQLQKTKTLNQITQTEFIDYKSELNKIQKEQFEIDATARLDKLKEDIDDKFRALYGKAMVRPNLEPFIIQEPVEQQVPKLGEQEQKLFNKYKYKAKKRKQEIRELSEELKEKKNQLMALEEQMTYMQDKFKYYQFEKEFEKKYGVNYSGNINQEPENNGVQLNNNRKNSAKDESELENIIYQLRLEKGFLEQENSILKNQLLEHQLRIDRLNQFCEDKNFEIRKLQDQIVELEDIMRFRDIDALKKINYLQELNEKGQHLRVYDQPIQHPSLLVRQYQPYAPHPGFMQAIQ